MSNCVRSMLRNRVGMEGLYELSVGGDIASLSAGGAASMIAVVFNRYTPKDSGNSSALEAYQRNESLLLETVRLSIGLMSGVSDLSCAKARLFHDAKLCPALALMLRLSITNSTYIGLICTCASMMCQRVPDCQDIFSTQTDFCATLGCSDVWCVKNSTGSTDTSTVLALLKVVKSLCYSNEHNRRLFCTQGIADIAVPVAVNCRDSKEGSAVLGLTCWAMYRLGVPRSTFLTSPESLSVVAQTLKCSDLKIKAAQSAFEAIAVLTKAPNQRNAVQLGLMQVCASTMNALNKFSDDAALVDAGVCALSGLCRECDQNRIALHRLGAISFIIKVLSRGSSSQSSVELAMRACADMITRNTEILTEIGAGSTLKVICESYQPKPGMVWSDDFSEAYCSFIGRLSAMGFTYQTKLTQYNFIDMMMLCTCKHLNSLPVCRSAMWAIYELSYRCKSNNIRLGSMGACQSVISVLKLHISVPLIELWACAALASLTANGCIDNIARVITVGAVIEISRVMENAVRVLASTNQSRQSFSAKHSSGADGSALGNDIEMLKFALWALCNISSVPTACAAFGDNGACAVCIDLLQLYYSRNVQLTILALLAISALCQTGSNRKKIKEYEKFDILEVLHSIGSHYTASDDEASLDLNRILKGTLERVRCSDVNLVLPYDQCSWDVSDGANNFAVRRQEDHLKVLSAC